MVGAYASSEFVEKFLASTLRRSVGETADPTVEELEALDSLNAGDTSALVDAIEPAMKSAHTVINHGASKIEVLTPKAELAVLDAETKRYVWTSRPDDEVQEKLLGIASYNANSREGRAFDYDLGKTIPFSIARGADRTTVLCPPVPHPSYARQLNRFAKPFTGYSPTRFKRNHLSRGRRTRTTAAPSGPAAW